MPHGWDFSTLWALSSCFRAAVLSLRKGQPRIHNVVARAHLPRKSMEHPRSRRSWPSPTRHFLLPGFVSHSDTRGLENNERDRG
jgi:hypothetical protein